jgi:hypothetical protein
MYIVFVDVTNTVTENQSIILWSCKAKTQAEAIDLVRRRSESMYANSPVKIDNISASELDLNDPAHYYGEI